MEMNGMIGRRLLFYMVLGCILPYTLGVLYIGAAIKNRAETEYVKRVDLLTDKIQFLLQAGMQVPVTEALNQFIAGEETVQLTEAIGDRLVEQAAQLPERSLRYLSAYHQSYARVIGSLVIATSTGGYLSYPSFAHEKTPDPRARAWFKQGMAQSKQVVITDPYMMKSSKEPSIFVARALQRGGNIVGVAAVEFNLYPLQQELERIRGVNGVCYMVLNSNDLIVMNPLNPEWVMKTPRELLLTELVDLRKKQTGLHPINLEGKQYLMRISISEKHGWAVVAFLDPDSIAAESRSDLYHIALAYGLGVLVILGVVAAGTRRITRPIEKLSRGAMAITNGDLNAKVDIMGKDEFGFLANSFNQMANTLKENFAKIQKQTEEIRKREREFQTLVENAQDIISRLDKAQRYLYVNPAIEAYIEVVSRDFINKTNAEIGFPAGFCRQLEGCYQKVFRTGRDRLIDLEFTTFAGNSVYLQAHVIPEFDKYGRVETVLSVMRNITERKEMEKHLARLDRLNLVGEMAAGIAHEVRNPMTTVRGYLQMLTRKGELSTYVGHFQLMIDELDRANEIITEFLALAKNKRVDLKNTNLNGIIQNLQPLIQADAYIADKLTAWELNKVPLLLIDEKEVRQLILNLARNGLEAMEAGGCLTVRTYTEAKEVVLLIQDQGHGIQPEILEKIGIPFMTTKENGTGLGLAVCYSIAARHHAKIDIQTSSEGTAVAVHFRFAP